jgi:glycosyltransferase XagB
LRRRHPDLSAGEPMWLWQKCAFAAIAGIVIVSGILAFSGTLFFVFAGLALPFSCVVALKFAALWHAATASWPASPPPGPDDVDWPRYSVLIPLFNEAGVVPDVIAALGRIDYPRDKMEILLILEQEDSATQAAVLSSILMSQMSVVIVPVGQPQTKPRALNYALAHATGDIVVVYDAEDLPEPDQLRRAAARLMSAPGVGCLQARLNIINDRENWLTRGFMAQTPQEVNPLPSYI